MNEVVSIVIPVFNVEAYLPKCIDSIIQQSYTNLEIILIDDGSTDCCGEICYEYAIKDKRIKLVHQSNGGVVKARNVGVTMATGDYLSFIDADDYIEPQMIELLVNEAEKNASDIVWCDWIEESGNNTKEVSANFDNSSEIMLRRLFRDEAKGYLWNKLIRKDFYDQCNLVFDENCTMMEDKYILVQLLCCYPKMDYVQIPLYHYVSRCGSAVEQSKLSPLVKGADNVEHMYETLLRKDLLKKYEHDFYKYAMQVKFALVNAGKYSYSQKYIPLAHRSLCDYPVPKRIALFYWLGFNLGVIGAFLLKFKNRVA